MKQDVTSKHYEITEEKEYYLLEFFGSYKKDKIQLCGWRKCKTELEAHIIGTDWLKD